MPPTCPNSILTYYHPIGRLAALAWAVTLILLLGFSEPTTAIADVPPSDVSYSNTELPEGLSAAEWAEITRQIQQSYYQVGPVAGGYQGHNPGQQWQTLFDGAGFRVKPDAGEWDWGLALRSYGYFGAERRLAEKAQVSTDGQRVIYRWDDNLSEWYKNDEWGLEHGFTLRKRPAKTDQFLQLTLQVSGSLRPQISADRAGVNFVDQHGASTIQYRDLYVYDRQGRTVPAWFELEAGGLRLMVDDRTARYPLTIDPIAQQAYLKASNTGTDDQFGYVVTLSGATLAVGVQYEDGSATGINGNQADNSASSAGAVYVFTRNGGVWSQQAYLKASNTGAGDSFGYTVALSGETLAVGAFNEDSSATGVNGNQADNSASNAGAVYVFTRSGSVWSQQAYLKASNTGAGDWFGYAVALSGDTLAVGAYSEASNATGVNGNQANDFSPTSGAVYVFTRSGSVWSQQAYLKASNTGINNAFGSAVALSGDTLAVGAVFEESNATGVNGNQADNSANGAGAVYVFTRSGSIWSQQAYLKASNTEIYDNFGNAVALSGDTLAVGTPGEDSSAIGSNGNQADNSANGAGAVYVFTRSGSIWSQQAYLKASNTGASDVFGWSVTLSGETLAVGAYGEDSSAIGVNGNQADNSANGAGAVYVFTRSGSVWSQQAYLKASNTGASDVFARAALSGETLAVGAYGEDSSATGAEGNQADNSASSAGAVYIFTLPAPEMAVIGNGVEIAAGDDMPSLTDHTDFGSIPLGGVITHTFTISNSGDGDLTISSLSLSGVIAGDFSLTSIVTPITVVSANTTTFQVRFNPSASGTHTATVTIANNDSDENPYNFTVLGTGANAAPVIAEGDSTPVTMSEDSSPTSFNLTLHATDDDGDTLTWSIQNQAVHGTASTSGTGPSKAISYIPSADYSGSDSFIVKVADGKGDQDTITVNVTVQPVNDAPRFVGGIPTFALKWGSTGSGNGQFTYPISVAVDSSGNVYVADENNHRIQKFDSNGAFLAKWGSSGSGDGQFRYPRGVAVDSSGNIYVADTGNNRIQKFDSSGTFLGKWGSTGSGDGQFSNPNDVAVDSGSGVYVADSSNDRIQKFDSNGAFLAKWGSSGSGDGQFYSPLSVTADGSGNVYVADTYNYRIQKFDSSGAFLAKWGSSGSGDGQFKSSFGVAVDGSGNVYAADTYNHRIQKFDSSGVLLDRWGSSGSGDGQFRYPWDAVVDSNSNLYVADTNNDRLQKFKPADMTTVAVTMSEDASPTPFSLILAASDADNDTLTWSIGSQASYGTASVSGTGTSKVISYTLSPNYNGSDNFVVKVADGTGSEDTIPVNVTIQAVNDTPVANAGSDQNVRVRVSVTLDGSVSSDPDGDSLTYGWTQTGGPAVTLSSATAVSPTFTTPSSTAVLTFSLVVTDSFGLADPTPDEVVVTASNAAPVIAEGDPAPVTMSEDASPTAFDLTLNASDADGDTLTWNIQSQASHGTATASGTGTSKVIAYTPATDYSGSDSFVVKVTDGSGGQDTITVNVTIQPVNDAPAANASSDQSVGVGVFVTLSGSLSNDPDGHPLTYGWTQTGGTSVTLDDPTAANPTFTTPGQSTVLTFTLTVTDSLGLADPTPDEVIITVTNQAPANNAGSDQSVHVGSIVTLNASGSHDPDGHPLTYNWTQTGGPAVSLSRADTISPTFTAPGSPTVLTFTLIATDSFGLAAPTADEVVVNVTNQAPVAKAGSDQNVSTGVVVTLNGSGSSDPDNDLPLTFGWFQTSGPAVTLSSTSAVNPTFTALNSLAVLTFSLSVTDSFGLVDSTPDEVVVAISQQRIYLPLVLKE